MSAVNIFTGCTRSDKNWRHVWSWLSGCDNHRCEYEAAVSINVRCSLKKDLVASSHQFAHSYPYCGQDCEYDEKDQLLRIDKLHEFAVMNEVSRELITTSRWDIEKTAIISSNIKDEINFVVLRPFDQATWTEISRTSWFSGSLRHWDVRHNLFIVFRLEQRIVQEHYCLLYVLVPS